MTEQIPNIGKTPATDARRDAIHFAVAPMTAGADLQPAQHVGVLPDGDTASAFVAPIGIVDPFRRGPVKAGERFWLFLYPNTITSLRHEWTHPALDSGSGAEARAWLESFADGNGQSYSDLLDGVREYLATGDAIHVGGNTWVDKDDREKLFHYFSIVTGREVAPEQAASAGFRCTC